MRRRLASALLLGVALASLLPRAAFAEKLPNISSIPPDLTSPPTIEGSPGPGLRVKETTPGWEDTSVHHTIYLPRNWRAGASFPVLFEYGGNGGYHDACGDTCTGMVEGCNLGYGLSAGLDYIWVCLPFVQARGGHEANAQVWWGDPSETVCYCVATVRHVCARYGGDPRRLVLCGFSRGSIACNYIGLRDETIAPLWMAFICHSHYDGVAHWYYADSDPASALGRLTRLEGRPQFISMEGSTAQTRRFLEDAGIRAPFSFVDFPFCNHTDTWALRDCDLRRAARDWLWELGLPDADHERDRARDTETDRAMDRRTDRRTDRGSPGRAK